ncbi:unnamed protein product, partial [Rotaria sp. Silwood1]
QHTFINGYRSILNCPAACTTNSIIYCLTCPYGQFDYIGKASLPLADRLIYHQEHGNRILQEVLLNVMKLYQHSAHCPSAIQWFLDENPDYWCFITQRMTEAEEQKEEKELIQ